MKTISYQVSLTYHEVG